MVVSPTLTSSKKVAAHKDAGRSLRSYQTVFTLAMIREVKCKRSLQHWHVLHCAAIMVAFGVKSLSNDIKI